MILHLFLAHSRFSPHALCRLRHRQRDNALYVESKALAKMDTASVLELISSTLEANSAPTGLGTSPHSASFVI